MRTEKPRPVAVCQTFTMLASAASLILLTLMSGCERKTTTQAPPASLKDPTGICYRRIAWFQEGAVHGRFEVILMRQSSSLAQDMARIEEVEHGQSGARSPDLTPNAWHSGWLADDHYDFTQGPDCSPLPKARE
jgi:hypothetical protein